MIQNITLPPDIAAQMSNKTLVRSKQDYEMMEQRFEMQEIALKNEVEQDKLKQSRRADIPLMNHGDAAATTWTFRGDGVAATPRPRRG